MTTGIADKIQQPDEKVQGKVPASDTRAAGNEEHTEEETPRTYSQKEVDALLGKAGGRMRAQLEIITRERDDFRSKHESVAKTHSDLTAQITTAQEEIQTLTDSFESLNSEDATKVKKLIRDWEKRLESLTEREKNLTPREERVNTFERTELIYTVADEFELDEPEAKDRFKAAADKLGIKDREGLVTLAETMNLQAREEEEPDEEKKPKAPRHYSGKSEGGTPYFTRAQIADRKFYLAHQVEIDKAMNEPGHPRIRD